MSDIPDDISSLPLTREEMMLGLQQPIEAILEFVARSGKLVPAELRDALDDMENTVSGFWCLIEEMV